MSMEVSSIAGVREAMGLEEGTGFNEISRLNTRNDAEAGYFIEFNNSWQPTL